MNVDTKATSAQAILVLLADVAVCYYAGMQEEACEKRLTKPKTFVPREHRMYTSLYALWFVAHHEIHRIIYS